MSERPVSPVHLPGHRVGPDETPFVIAEVSGNHNGSLDRALEIIDAIAASGAQAVKFQTYTADTLTIDAPGPQFRIRAGHDLWGGRTLHDLYDEAHTPWEWHAPMFERARAHGLLPFSSPFDPSAIELLACTASYPADPADARLLSIPTLREAFGIPIGLSDHTAGIGVSVAAVALGAVALEKHVTLRRDDGGVDSDFSLEPDELAALVRETAAARLAVAPPRFGPTEAERDTLALRRSLYVVADVRAGDPVTAENVRSIRPAGGLPTDTFASVVGRTFSRDVERGTPLTWDLI